MSLPRVSDCSSRSEGYLPKRSHAFYASSGHLEGVDPNKLLNEIAAATLPIADKSFEASPIAKKHCTVLSRSCSLPSDQTHLKALFPERPSLKVSSSNSSAACSSTFAGSLESTDSDRTEELSSDLDDCADDLAFQEKKNKSFADFCLSSLEETLQKLFYKRYSIHDDQQYALLKGSIQRFMCVKTDFDSVLNSLSRNLTEVSKPQTLLINDKKFALKVILQYLIKLKTL